MRRAVRAIGALVGRIMADVWPEGVLFGVATGLFAVGASFISPAGPWFVAGAMCLALGVALTLPPRAR